KSLRTGSIYLPRLVSQNTQVKIRWTEKNAKEVPKWMLVPETIELCTSLLKNKFEGSYLEGFETLISNLKLVLINRILAQSKKPILKKKIGLIEIVPIHAWEEYFRELYTDPDYITKESQISLDQTPYWSP
ncbi:hypothetical protein E2320_007336, partial [Naja naja]